MHSADQTLITQLKVSTLEGRKYKEEND
jgi:hypothetical protein